MRCLLETTVQRCNGNAMQREINKIIIINNIEIDEIERECECGASWVDRSWTFCEHFSHIWITFWFFVFFAISKWARASIGILPISLVYWPARYVQICIVRMISFSGLTSQFSDRMKLSLLVSQTLSLPLPFHLSTLTVLQRSLGNGDRWQVLKKS